MNHASDTPDATAKRTQASGPFPREQHPAKRAKMADTRRQIVATVADLTVDQQHFQHCEPVLQTA